MTQRRRDSTIDGVATKPRRKQPAPASFKPKRAAMRTPSSIEPDSKSTPFQSAINALTIPGLIFAVGIGVITLNYWSAVCLMTLSLPVFWITLYRTYDNDEKYKRIIGFVISIGVFVLMVWMVWSPVAVNASISYSAGDFAAETVIYGIKWQKSYSEIVLDLPNASSGEDLTNIDAYLWVDAQILDAGIAKGINTCNWEPYQPYAIGAASIKVTNVVGLSEIPLAQDKWNAPIFHIHCERLARKISDRDGLRNNT